MFAAYALLTGESLEVPEVVWRDDVAPLWGDSRWEGDDSMFMSGPAADMPRHGRAENSTLVPDADAEVDD